MRKRLFIPHKHIKKMQRYIIELNYQSGFMHTSSTSLCMKVIEKVARKLGDKKPPSTSTLVMWQMRNTSIKRK